MKKRSYIYDTYWRFAAERQSIFFNRLHGGTPPYTHDPILQAYKFCNTYRASDRVSQFLIKDIIYGFSGDEQSIALRILLFRFLNKIETWRALERKLGEQVSIHNFSFKKYASIIEQIQMEQGSIYGNAFILAPTTAYGYKQKHLNHLALIEDVFVKNNDYLRILHAQSLRSLFERLTTFPMIGIFMGYQIAIDLNYSTLFNFDENDFTIAGPGAKRGIVKCFEDADGRDDAYIISYMVDHQNIEFARLGIAFQDLGGRKLHAIDCQGLFCETDKYSRIRFPHITSNRKRMKEQFKNEPKEPITYFYPPKWGINEYFEVLTRQVKKAKRKKQKAEEVVKL